MAKDNLDATVAKLIEASRAYYGGDKPIMSDSEYDSLVLYVEDAYNSGEHDDFFTENPEALTLFNGDEVSPGMTLDSSADSSVAHDIPMLSLAKAKTESELYNFVSKMESMGAEGFTVQPKFDGLAVSVSYTDGSWNVVSTRGDGHVGENANGILTDKLSTVVGIPLKSKTHDDIEIRGELLFSKDQFEAVNKSRLELSGEQFSNSRNAVSGLLKKTIIGLEYPVEFSFITYSIIVNGSYVNLDSIHQFFNRSNIVTPLDVYTCGVLRDRESISEKIASFKDLRSDFLYPTDGVVIKPVNESYMLKKAGFTSHHPVSQIAWKYPAEQKTSVVRDVLVSVGKTGRITPKAVIDPVDIDGSVVSNVSLHNYSVVESLDVRIGSVVIVQKANDIIPQIVSVVDNSHTDEKLEPPTSCPECGHDVVAGPEGVKTLKCANELCPSRWFFMLKMAVGRDYLDIDRLGNVALENLYNSGRVRDISDLFTLTVDELSETGNGVTKNGTVKKLGSKTAEHIVKKVEEAKNRPFYAILASLAIPNLGLQTAKQLVQRYNSIDELMSATVSELSQVEGLSLIKATAICEGLKQRESIISKLKSLGVKMSTDAQQSSDKLEGLSFSITGAVPEQFSRRQDFIDYVTSNGAEFHASPKSSTRFIVGDANDKSSKMLKALSLGVTVISPDEFSERFYTL